MPTQAAPTVPTPEATPQQTTGPYPQPPPPTEAQSLSGDGSSAAESRERGSGGHGSDRSLTVCIAPLPFRSSAPYLHSSPCSLCLHTAGKTNIKSFNDAEPIRHTQGLATNMLLGKQSKPGHQSGLVGLAGSLIGGGGQASHGSSHGGGPAGLVGKIAGGILGGGGKPHGSGTPSSSGHQQGGLAGFASGLMGGHHASVRQQQALRR